MREQLTAAKVERATLVETQRELEATIGRYADLYDFAPVGCITLSQTGIIQDVNPVAARLLGTDRRQLLEEPLMAWVAKMDLRNFQSYLSRLQKHPGEMTVDLWFESKLNGTRLLQLTSIIAVDRALDDVHFHTVLTDITQRRRVENSILELNETVMTMLEAIPDVFLVFDADGRMHFRNQAASRFLLANDLNRVPESIEGELNKVLQTGQHSLPADLKAVHRFMIGHEERYFLSRIVCLLNPQKTTLGAVVMLQDVTELRLLDEVKTGLISTVSHELKTPITSVRTALLIMLEQTLGPLNEKQAELLGIARDEGERLLHTLDALLDLTRFESNAMETRAERVRPGELIREAIAVVRGPAAARRMKVKMEAPASLPMVEVDRERIMHVLTNFLTNAIKYSPVGTEITVRVKVVEGGMRFSVSDRGPGVPEQYRLRIFEKFFRIPGVPAQGAGLGLNIAREFVLAHAGQIGVNCESGKGSEFFFVLPAKRL